MEIITNKIGIPLLGFSHNALVSIIGPPSSASATPPMRIRKHFIIIKYIPGEQETFFLPMLKKQSVNPLYLIQD